MTDTEVDPDEPSNEPAEGTITSEDLVQPGEAAPGRFPNDTELQEIRGGQWGSRKTLRTRLTEAGFDYKAVLKELHKK